jgi:glycosyltransferase involved in cell wall biosynthesis
VRVTTVFAGVPNPWQAGGPLTHRAILGVLVESGHDVLFCSLPWEADQQRTEQLAALRALGVRVKTVAPRREGKASSGRWRARLDYARALTWPDDSTLFPTNAYATALAEVLRDERPEVVLAHGTPAVSATYGLAYPKLALMSDPPGLSRRLRTQYEPTHRWRLGRDELLYRLGAASYASRADRRILAMLRRYDSVGVFAAHHAEWAARHGVKAWYASSPIADAAGPAWRERRAGAPVNERPRILMIGHLRGISTISGLHVLVQDVLPGLDRGLGSDGYEVHVVGDYEPPRSLRGALEHPAVRLRGHVEPPDEEFLRADVLLVPTPVPTGPRIRIITGFSFGCCVVAHVANRRGIPALADSVNALLGERVQLAGLTVAALRDPALRHRLGEAGRLLYEARFTPEKAGGRIVGVLEELAAAESPSLAPQGAGQAR